MLNLFHRSCTKYRQFILAEVLSIKVSYKFAHVHCMSTLTKQFHKILLSVFRGVVMTICFSSTFKFGQISKFILRTMLMNINGFLTPLVLNHRRNPRDFYPIHFFHRNPVGSEDGLKCIYIYLILFISESRISLILITFQ